MAENFSVERRKMMRFLGAKVVLTPAAEKGTGMLAKAVELAEAHGWFLCRQFENEANADIHSRTTARGDPRGLRRRAARLLGDGRWHGRDAEGRRARAARAAARDEDRASASPTTRRCSAAEFRNRARPTASPTTSHPLFRPHLVQGWTPDFIPKLTEDALRDEARRSAWCRSTAARPCDSRASWPKEKASSPARRAARRSRAR